MTMTLQHYQQHQRGYEAAMLCGYLFINNSINATSVVMEASRRSDTLPFQIWEPFAWEYSSAIGTLVMFPFVVWLLNRFAFDWQNIGRSVLTYLLGSVVFSIGHIGIMVAIRKGIYGVLGKSYDFGDLWFELLYEYRKDLWGFLFLITVILVYRFILSRLQGEANPIAEGEPAADTGGEKTVIDRLLVKKLGKEFIIKVSDVEWMEASGNYVNMYIDERVYPLRATLGRLSSQLEAKGFCRVHRSHIVRLDAIESITPLSSGDSEIKLQSGKVLNLSRRYKDCFKQQLQGDPQ